MDIMTAPFDQDEVTRRCHLRIRREEAPKAEAMAKARVAKVATALPARGMAMADIAECAGLTAAEIKKLSNS
ncbi:MAG: hypothetical protein J6333_10860 [Planctomycetes bacterium]|nr:hypothetical protein [Planctomycetota bacterium]